MLRTISVAMVCGLTLLASQAFADDDIYIRCHGEQDNDSVPPVPPSTVPTTVFRRENNVVRNEEKELDSNTHLLDNKDQYAKVAFWANQYSNNKASAIANANIQGETLEPLFGGVFNLEWNLLSTVGYYVGLVSDDVELAAKQTYLNLNNLPASATAAAATTAPAPDGSANTAPAPDGSASTATATPAQPVAPYMWHKTMLDKDVLSVTNATYEKLIKLCVHRINSGLSGKKAGYSEYPVGYKLTDITASKTSSDPKKENHLKVLRRQTDSNPLSFNRMANFGSARDLEVEKAFREAVLAKRREEKKAKEALADTSSNGMVTPTITPVTLDPKPTVKKTTLTTSGSGEFPKLVPQKGKGAANSGETTGK